MNKLFITGNLTREPRMRYLDDGKAVCDFAVAVNPPVSRANRDAEEVDFFEVTAWRKMAENCGKYLAKGRKVTVVGPVHQEMYTARDGTRRAVMRVIATDVEFIDKPADSGQGPVASGQENGERYHVNGGDGFAVVDEPDLPF